MSGSYSYPNGGTAVTIGTGLTATNDGAGISGATVYISSGFQPGDTLSVSAFPGITPSYNAATGVLTLSGVANGAGWQTVLRTVTFSSTSGMTGARSIEFSLGTALPYPGTGHFYEYVPSVNITWTAANAAASSRNYFGRTGYLATITSGGEDAFIYGKLGGGTDWMWIGSSDAATEGVWQWVTGPESGSTFCIGNNPPGCIVQPDWYANWSAGEPNNMGIEDYGLIYGNLNGYWNDYWSTASGYVVEYGGMPGDTPLDTTGTVTVNVSLSPEFDLDVSGAYNYTSADPAIAISAALTATSNPAGGNMDGATVLVGTNFNIGDTLAVSGYASPWNGISWSYNSTTGVLSFTGTSSINNYQTLLRAVTFSSATSVTSTRTVDFSLGTSLPYGPTGHFFEYVSSAGVTWAAANAAASARTYYGRTGYLATINSAGENAFAASKVGGSAARIGGSDAATEGTWQWDTGPEAGTTFCIGNNPPGCVVQPGWYTNWNTGEPNDASGEDYIQFIIGGAGIWNDLSGASNPTVNGYVVEYGGLAGDFPQDISGSVTVNVTGDAAFPIVTLSVPADGAVLNYPGPTQLTVTFSENMLGDGSQHSANSLWNYMLVRPGPNGIFDTTVTSVSICDSDHVAEGDDERIEIASITYDAITYTATLNIAAAELPLANGQYRLYVCGAASIWDLSGNPLNGGANSAVNFTVSPAPSALPATGFAPDRVTALPPQAESYAASDLRLEIPRLGVSMDIVGVPQSGNTWDVSWLGRNAGWLQGTAFPTWSGNSVITAHVWNADNSAGPFVYLNTLWYGDRIIVHAWGQQYVYEVRSVTQVRPDSTVAAFQHKDTPWLTLTTCRSWNADTGTYRYRVIVQAALVSIK
ncbi:MAG: hmu [Anaerolineaceae bacterium]|nr:MAG: hmu [Anaerolineaceae bacterium]